MKSDKLRPWKIGGGILGALVFGVAGFLFGRYGFPGLDISKAWVDLQDPDSTSSLFGWVLGILGIPFGAKTGGSIGEKYRARRRRREWLERHPEQAAAIQEQKEMLREEERQRKARRSSRRKRRP